MLGILHRSLMAVGTMERPLSIDDYMTVESLEDGLTVTFTGNPCEYSIDGITTWVELPSGTPTPTLNAGQTISFRAEAVVDYYAGIGVIAISKNAIYLATA